MSGLNETPRANRLHIGFFGKRNSGKSSLINAFAKQDISIVSDVAGTTTDPVYKSMEILPLGPCVLIDTAGFDDIGELGETRVEKTKLAAEKTDIAVVLVSGDELSKEKEWFDYFVDRKIPVMLCISKADTLENPEEYKSFVEKEFKAAPIVLSSKTKEGLPEFKEQLLRSLPEDFEMPSITGDLCGENDLVMLVMPQDIQAPKGRLILPQVQTIRELLDKKCVVISCTTDKIDQTLSTLKNSPKLIICDSQVFKTVWEKKPDESRITSFSTLFAGYKGDIEYYIEGAESIDKLDESSKILIAECCTHAPLSEDIGREKLPRLLRKRLGEGLQVDFVSGSDFPEDLTKYDLVIQCGACMFNRRYVMSRIERAKEQGVMMSNYGVVIAKLNKILDKISY
ncbi:MAG: [FeFe] hydrogenase H-cluster maturation GTPase HydF [Ruminococcus sp.]|nr:[FeFe] hydrogenase H-cluster maturation GTPase HydF [Ruminococcus sp.]